MENTVETPVQTKTIEQIYLEYLRISIDEKGIHPLLVYSKIKVLMD